MKGTTQIEKGHHILKDHVTYKVINSPINKRNNTPRARQWRQKCTNKRTIYQCTSRGLLLHQLNHLATAIAPFSFCIPANIVLPSDEPIIPQLIFFLQLVSGPKVAPLQTRSHLQHSLYEIRNRTYYVYRPKLATDKLVLESHVLAFKHGTHSAINDTT